MSKDDYQLLPATVDDVSEIAPMWIDAFTDDPIICNLDPAVDAATKLANGEIWHREMMETAHLSGARFTKVVEKSTRKIVGYGQWIAPIILTESQKAELAAFEARVHARPLPEGTNVPLHKFFFGQLAEKRKQWSDPEKDYFYHLLAVARTHHRRGIGGILLQDCLDEADKAGARTYIEASAMGMPLYMKHGWELIDEIVVDLDRYAATRFSGKHIEACLMRPAKKRSDAILAA